MTFTINSPMPPEWLMYPWIEQGSIGWRMGYGEGYLLKLDQWLDGLSPKEQDQWQEMFPPPLAWHDGVDEESAEMDDYWFMNKGHLVPYWQKSGASVFNRETLMNDYKRGKPLEFLFFWSHQKGSAAEINAGCLSQWYPAEFKSSIGRYHCMEQYMMAEKARIFGDKAIEAAIMAEVSPKVIKDLGRKVAGFSDHLWRKARYTVVLNGNYQKFIQNPDLLAFLLATGDKVLVEASPYDSIWGIKMAANDPNAANPLAWRGENLLGFALMEVRDELRRVLKNAAKVDWSKVKAMFAQ